jgi:uncharacterized protein YodC (DUF2158 family)
MSEQQLKVGDTVRLKSGGPLMTVTGVGHDRNHKPMVWCSWFTDNKEDRGTFPVEAVEIDN